jgi:hypothetical protein
MMMMVVLHETPKESSDEVEGRMQELGESLIRRVEWVGFGLRGGLGRLY